MMRFLTAIPTNNINRLTFEDAGAPKVTLKQGVRIGSVLFTLSLLFKIDDLGTQISEANVSLLSNDVAI